MILEQGPLMRMRNNKQNNVRFCLLRFIAKKCRKVHMKLYFYSLNISNAIIVNIWVGTKTKRYLHLFAFSGSAAKSSFIQSTYIPNNTI